MIILTVRIHREFLFSAESFSVCKKILLQNMRKMDKIGLNRIFQECCCYCVLFFPKMSQNAFRQGSQETTRGNCRCFLFFKKMMKEEIVHILTILMTWEEILILILGKLDQKKLK